MMNVLLLPHNVDLKANEKYWVRADSMPSGNSLKWRNGTPREATVEGYKAMIETAITIKIP